MSSSLSERLFRQAEQSRRPDWGGGSVLLSDGTLYGALGQGQIILVHIYLSLIHI